MVDYWDDYAPDNDDSASEYVSFKEVGDSVRGRIVELRAGSDFKGDPCPEIVFDTDTGRKVWTVGQKVGQRKLAEVRPREGWVIEVRYSGVGDAKPGKAPAKLFTVEVISGGNTSTTQVKPFPTYGIDDTPKEQQVMTATDL